MYSRTARPTRLVSPVAMRSRNAPRSTASTAVRCARPGAVSHARERQHRGRSVDALPRGYRFA
jgi:hypothetical protein